MKAAEEYTSIDVSPDNGNISKGKLIAKDITLYHQWELSIDLKLTKSNINGWSNVFLVAGVSPDGTQGHRIPARDRLCDSHTN